MTLVIDVRGGVHTLYSEVLDLALLGVVSIRRASYVEPDDSGKWWAHLSPMDGPLLGPYWRRSEALDAERDWLETNQLHKEISLD